jgi:hypothetical protein
VLRERDLPGSGIEPPPMSDARLALEYVDRDAPPTMTVVAPCFARPT